MITPSGATTKIKGLILRATKYSEADLILTFLSSEGEKVSAIAKSALKSKKRFLGGVLEPTHFVEFVLTIPKIEGRLPVIEQAQLIQSFDQLRSDYDRLNLALRILELVSKMAQEGDLHSKELFNLLGNTLKELQTAPNLEILQLQFFLKLLMQQGVLEPEAWMKSFLSRSMKDNAILAVEYTKQKNVLLSYLAWAEEQLKTHFG